MELKEHLAVLAKREKSKIGNIIAAYEVKKWPEGRIDELVGMGMLISISDATTIKCPCCSKGCPVKPIKEVGKDGTESYYVLCDKEGSNEIDPFYFKRWQITEKIRKYLPKSKQKRNRKASAELSPREQQVYSMTYVRKMTPQQIAIELNCSAQNVYKHIGNAEKKMQAKNSRSINLSKAQKLPEDRRGQSTIEAESFDLSNSD